MALHTVGELKQSISGLLTGMNLTTVTDLDGALERAARTLVQQADVPEASGRQAITLYDGVFDYSAPSTIFGGALVDLRPQGIDRSPLDYVYKKPIEQFDRTKHLLPNGYMVTFEYELGEGIMRVSTPTLPSRAVVDPMNATTGWTAAGSASGLTADETTYWESPASLRFTLTGSSTGTLTKTLTNTIDMETFEDLGVAFLAIRIPSGATASAFTSISLKLGSDSSNYDEVSDTDGFLGAWIAGDWLLVAFDFAGSTSTGTPDWTAIDYVQVSFAHTSTFTNFRVGGLWVSKPSPHEVLFSSSAIFLATGSTTPLQAITADNDTVMLNDAGYTLYEHECALTIALQSAGGVATPLVQTFRTILHDPLTGLYPQYRADNPSGEIRTVGSWY